VLTLLLVASLAGVGLKMYWDWQKGPWDLPGPVQPKRAADSVEEKTPARSAPVTVGTDVIIAKNLFDPERGANRIVDGEADSRAVQRIRSLVLLGTAILGSSRYAIVQDGDEPQQRFPAGKAAALPGPRRLKVGENIEGFNLIEVREKAVVFAKGATRVEIPIDYFRKVPVAATPTTPPPGQSRVPGRPVPGLVPGQVTPGVVPDQPGPGVVPRMIPNLPRRPRLPVPSAPQETKDQ